MPKSFRYYGTTYTTARFSAERGAQYQPMSVVTCKYGSGRITILENKCDLLVWQTYLHLVTKQQLQKMPGLSLIPISDWIVNLVSSRPNPGFLFCLLWRSNLLGPISSLGPLPRHNILCEDWILSDLSNPRSFAQFFLTTMDHKSFLLKRSSILCKLVKL